MSIEICGGVSPDSQEDGHGVRVALIPGGLSSPYDYKLFRESIYKNSPMVDIAITTPNSISKWGMSTRYIDFFSNVPTLVIDEADMLLDGGYIQGLNNILIGFNRADRIIRKQQMESLTAEQTAEQTTQYIFVAATLPNSGLKSCYAYLNKKFPKSEKVIMKNFHNACHTGLEESEPTKWVKMDDLRERLDMLKGMLVDREELQQEKVMVFLNAAVDVDQVTDLLRLVLLTFI